MRLVTGVANPEVVHSVRIMAPAVSLGFGRSVFEARLLANCRDRLVAGLRMIDVAVFCLTLVLLVPRQATAGAALATVIMNGLSFLTTAGAVRVIGRQLRLPTPCAESR